MKADYFQNDLRKRTQAQDERIREIKVRLAMLRPVPTGGMSSYFESLMRSTNDFIRQRMKNPKDFRGIAFWG